MVQSENMNGRSNTMDPLRESSHALNEDNNGNNSTTSNSTIRGINNTTIIMNNNNNNTTTTTTTNNNNTYTDNDDNRLDHNQPFMESSLNTLNPSFLPNYHDLSHRHLHDDSSRFLSTTPRGHTVSTRNAPRDDGSSNHDLLHHPLNDDFSRILHTSTRPHAGSSTNVLRDNGSSNIVSIPSPPPNLENNSGICRNAEQPRSPQTITLHNALAMRFDRPPTPPLSHDLILNPMGMGGGALPSLNTILSMAIDIIDNDFGTINDGEQDLRGLDLNHRNSAGHHDGPPRQ